jgi:hypothetical protein
MPENGGVFGQNRHAFFPFQFIGIHDGGRLILLLMSGKGLGLLQHGIHERGFAVVDVGDNSDITQLRLVHSIPF